MSGAANRRRGHNLEREIARQFREIGYHGAKTTREADPLADPRGQDITGVYPFFPQCKSVQALGSHHRVLGDLEPMSDEIPVLFHKRKRQGTTVTLWADDFLELVEMLKTEGVLK